MTEPLRRIPFQIAGRLALGDVFRYLDPFVFVTHQFGFVRANVDTGEVIVRVGIGYQNPIFPPSDIGQYVVGDQNQTVTQMAVDGSWIVTDNLGNTSFRPYPAALVWHAADLSFRGYVSKQSGYWWDRGGVPVMSGDLCYVPNDRGSYDFFNAGTLRWVGANADAPASTAPTSVRGFTYRWQPLDGSGQSQYELVRSDVATEPIPDTPPPPVVTPPPPTEEPTPMPTPDVSQPCPEGYYRNLFTGECEPGTAPAPTLPPPATGLDALLFHSDRFRAVAKIGDTRFPVGQACKGVMLTAQTGAFYFTDPTNLEVFVKVIDGTPVNGKWWVFIAGLTDVGVTVEVTDTTTGAQPKKYAGKQGEAFPSVQDTEGFAA